MSNKYRSRFFDTRETHRTATRQSLFDMTFRAVIEFGSDLLRGKRANDELLFLKNRRFSAACCGELQCYPDGEQTMYMFILLAVALEQFIF
jgi:hypothetical protein